MILVVGVNGTGKTTTIGKLASKLREHGRSVLVGAADTFRAAAEEQLEIWAERAGADFVGSPRGADPAAVAYDAVEAARARGHDVVIVDTAGRLHTQTNLMAELEKLRRVISGRVEGAPHETLLVVDATTGQNALQQARLFGEAVGVTGVALTKLDGSARGGVAIAIAVELGLPVKLVGVGEGVDDLRPFDARDYARALVGRRLAAAPLRPSSRRAYPVGGNPCCDRGRRLGMAVAMFMHWDGVVPHQYDALMERLELDANPAAGDVLHLATFTDEGLAGLRGVADGGCLRELPRAPSAARGARRSGSGRPGVRARSAAPHVRRRPGHDRPDRDDVRPGQQSPAGSPSVRRRGLRPRRR